MPPFIRGHLYGRHAAHHGPHRNHIRNKTTKILIGFVGVVLRIGDKEFVNEHSDYRILATRNFSVDVKSAKTVSPSTMVCPMATSGSTPFGK